MERDSCAGGELTTYLWQLLALEVVLDTAPTTPDNNSASRLLLCKSLRERETDRERERERERE
eukprot:COSAG03_NODE_12518_length_543_cov_1.308559_1_plen_62_part_10